MINQNMFTNKLSETMSIIFYSGKLEFALEKKKRMSSPHLRPIKSEFLEVSLNGKAC